MKAARAEAEAAPTAHGHEASASTIFSAIPTMSMHISSSL
jgi:hypothetical protein